MKRTIGVIPATAAVLLALALGAGSTWLFEKRIEVHMLRSMALVHELETAGLCASGLKLDAANKREVLTTVLEHRLDSALAHASALVDRGVGLDFAAPNLRDSLLRAADHYSATSQVEKQRRAETLFAELRNSSVNDPR
jgi:hypothetical protein